jgi:hypothetical protein
MRKKNRKFMKNWSITNLTLSLSLLIIFGACDKITSKSSEEIDPVVAEVGSLKLKKSDLAFLTNDSFNKEDSVNIIKMYLETWVRQQIMVKEALKNIPIDETELNRKVQDYKNSLLVYEFEKNYVEKNLKEVSAEEIVQYYEANNSNLRLKETIVKVQYLKLEKASKSNPMVERSLLTKDTEKIREIALKDAATFFLEDSVWVKFEDLINNTPFAQNKNKINLRNNTVIRENDSGFNYYLLIIDHKIRGEIPPLEFVREEVVKIVKNKKRTALALELQQEIYNRALQNNEFKIYEY